MTNTFAPESEFAEPPAKDWATDSLVKKFGGLFSAKNAGEGDLQLVELLQDVYRDNINLLHKARPELCLHEVHLVITAAETCSAFAYSIDDCKVVLINIGLIRSFWTKIATIAHLPDVLSELHPIQECIQPDWLISNNKKVPAAINWPGSEERTDFFIEVYTHMLEHLIMHELAHHMRGHLDLVNSIAGIAEIDEGEIRSAPWPPAGSESTFHIQDLELDADAHGLDLSVATLVEQFPNLVQKGNFENISQIIFLMIFSQILVAQQFDKSGRDPTNHLLHEHPAPVYRSVNFTNLMCHTFEKLVGGTMENYSDICSAAWTEAGKVAEYFQFPYGRWHGHDYRPLVDSHFVEIAHRYYLVTDTIDKVIDEENASLMPLFNPLVDHCT